MEHLTGDVRRLRGQQKGDDGGDLGRRSQASERHTQPLPLVFGELARHVGFDETRRHRVAADSETRRLEGETAGEADQAGLGGRVVGAHPPSRAVRRERRHVHDAAALRLAHHPVGRARSGESRFEIHALGRAPGVEVETSKRDGAAAAGVVHQTIDPSATIDDLLHQRRRVLGLVEIGGQREGGVTTEFAAHRLHLGRVPPVYSHRRSQFGSGLGRRPADTASRTGDQDHLAGE